jgi:hypothetical protein
MPGLAFPYFIGPIGFAGATKFVTTQPDKRYKPGS